MALNLYTNPATPPVSNPADWNNFVAREDGSNRGTGTAIDTISLTKWDASTDRPLIAQGSVIEVGGSLYLADSDTALVDDGGLADGAVHIKLVPSGGTVIPTLTSDVIPAWDATKGGWYDSDDKFLPFEMTRSGAITKVYSNKIRFPYQNKTYSFSSVGALDIDGALNVGGSGTFGGGVSCTNLATTGGDPVFDSVKSGSSFLKWKVFTGTLNGSGDVSLAHGLTYTNIVGFAMVYSDNATFTTYDGLDNSFGSYTSTTFTMNTATPNAFYRITIFYT